MSVAICCFIHSNLLLSYWKYDSILLLRIIHEVRIETSHSSYFPYFSTLKKEVGNRWKMTLKSFQLRCNIIFQSAKSQIRVTRVLQTPQEISKWGFLSLKKVREAASHLFSTKYRVVKKVLSLVALGGTFIPPMTVTTIQGKHNIHSMKILHMSSIKGKEWVKQLEKRLPEKNKLITGTKDKTICSQNSWLIRKEEACCQLSRSSNIH